MASKPKVDIKSKIHILGATGFIGRNLVHHFAQNEDYEVTAIYHSQPIFDAPNVTWIQADLTRSEDCLKAISGADVVIQAAATTSGVSDTISRPYVQVTDNAVMNSLALRAAYDCNVKHFVFFSCTVMYQSSDVPLKEEDFHPEKEMVPNYFGSAWTKVYIEKQCEFYSRLGRTKFSVLRHSNIFGPYDKFDLRKGHVCAASVEKVMNSKDGKVEVWGSGQEARDLLYVDDPMEAVRTCIEFQTSFFEIFNVGSGIATEIRHLVAAIIEESGKPLEVHYNPNRPTVPTSLCVDCSKITAQLGWVPRTALRDGIRKTIRWYEHHQAKARDHSAHNQKYLSHGPEKT